MRFVIDSSSRRERRIASSIARESVLEEFLVRIAVGAEWVRRKVSVIMDLCSARC